MQYTRIAKLANRIQKRRARRGQKGFTLLELLVVVAILAAIAGTATIALQDTDMRASAAAHVAMMDELNKGIATYRVLQKNELPTAFDSLIQMDTSATPSLTDAEFLETIDEGLYASLAVAALDSGTASVLSEGGLDALMYVAEDISHSDGDYNCTNITEVIESRSNNVVPGNIFLSGSANGCGYKVDLANGIPVAVWNDNYERILGSAGKAFDDADYSGAPVMMAVGVGPSSTLFEQGKLGTMTSVPVYRHVSGAAYNRFVALFTIGEFASGTHTLPTGTSDVESPADFSTAGTWSATDQVNLVTVIDGAGDTKEEELGEWDGQRNTI